LTNQFDLANLRASLQPDVDVEAAIRWPTVPAEFDTAEKRPAWLRDWHGSAAGRLSDDVYSRLYGVEVHSDGTFLADFIQPGKYWLNGNYLEGPKAIVTLSDHIEIPAGDASNSSKPFDLGSIPLQAGSNLPPGAFAPDFTAELLDGAGTFKLSDCRGKYVILDFWATWSQPSIADLPYLDAAYEEFRTNKMLIMVGLSLDADRAAPRKFVQDNIIRWKQASLGDWSRDTVTPSFGIRSIPEIVLIGPDGRIMAGLHGKQVKQALETILKR